MPQKRFSVTINTDPVNRVIEGAGSFLGGLVGRVTKHVGESPIKFAVEDVTPEPAIVDLATPEEDHAV